MKLPSVLAVLGIGRAVTSLRVVFPADRSEVYSPRVLLNGGLSNDDLYLIAPEGSSDFCWELKSRYFNEVVGGCWPVEEAFVWNGTVVGLTNRGYFDLTARLVRRGPGGSAQAILAEATSTFLHTIKPACREALRGRSLVQPNYYESMMVNREEGSPDDEEDNNIHFEFTPHCYDSWEISDSTTYDEILASYLMVTSSSRGMFGVDYSAQQFGHGDRMMLDFVLAKHRDSAGGSGDLVEMGTFGGVTALYLGMAARLRGGTLTTFGIEDDRSGPVKSAWLDNMVFHLGDANGRAAAAGGPASTLPQAVEAIRSAGLVLVDHADRLNFSRCGWSLCAVQARD